MLGVNDHEGEFTVHQFACTGTFIYLHNDSHNNIGAVQNENTRVVTMN